MKTAFNGCKSFGCPNLANPDLSLYRKTDQLGFDSYQCPECGAFTPVLDDSAINQFIEHAIRTQTPLALPHCIKCNQRTPSRRFGRTKAGTSRCQCEGCGSVYSLLNEGKLSEQLQPLLDLIIDSKSVEAVHRQAGLNSKIFYQRLSKLEALIRLANRLLLQTYFNSQPKLSLQSYSSRLDVRSGKQKACLTTWQLHTVDAEFGFKILVTDNLLQGHAETSSPYVLDYIEPQFPGSDMFEHVQWTYDKIFARNKFDNLGYTLQRQAHSNEGTLVRPVIAAHTHFQLLNDLLPTSKPTDLLLEHESFIRGSSIFAFSEPVKQGQTNLYYLYQSKAQEPAYPEQKKIGWWNETWVKFPSIGVKQELDVVLCSLTKGGLQCVDKLTQDWASDYQEYLETKLPNKYRQTLSHKICQQWLGISQYLYNTHHGGKRGALLKSSLNGDFNFRSIGNIVDLINQTARSRT
ncbi:hypothetical protein EJ063_01260 [Vibrio aquaticus]|uniref:IS1 family transposase n=1 Tax=Vibrio aquaticus TaxID=2496559 RepID=A0A3S0P856_9VIBR|nr:hypothetical protein [Vibrio aquaticus]RTZ17439.1 hypothetical protein EJ063_01260 [Vibrio aquaticus]